MVLVTGFGLRTVPLRDWPSAVPSAGRGSAPVWVNLASMSFQSADA